MNRRSFFSILVASVLLPLLMGASGFYGLSATGPLSLLPGSPETSPTAAMFVPKQAAVMVSLLVDIDELEASVQRFAGRANQGKSRAELNQIKATLLANTDLDYEQDIQPWLGNEITFAVTSLDFDRERANGSQPGYLVAIATKEPQKSREFLEQFWQNKAIAGTELAFEQYKAVKLIYSKTATASGSPLSGTWASAVVGDKFVLFANHPKVLRDAINNVQAPNLNLKSNPAYQQALQQLKTNPIGLTFVNLPQFLSLIGSKPTNASPDPENNVSKTQTATGLYDNVAIALELNPQGLVAQTAWISDKTQASVGEIKSSLSALSSPVGAAEYLPANVAFLAAGADLNGLWNQFKTGVAGGNLISPFFNQPLADLQARWGIDLPQDIFSWVQGEYALGLLPTASNTFDWIFVAQKTAGAEAMAAVEKLDAIAQSRGFNIGPLTLANQPISAWTKLKTVQANTEGQESGLLKLKAEVAGVRASVGNYQILTNSIQAMDAALQAPLTGSSLARDPIKGAIAPLPKPNHGYLYLDWLASKNILEQQLPLLKLIELAAGSLFDHLSAIALSSPSDTGGVPRASIFIHLSN